MAFFNPEAYELLLQRVRATQMKDDLEIVRDTSNDCLKYVWTVCEGENRLNTADRPDQIMVGDYDSKRHNAAVMAYCPANLFMTATELIAFSCALCRFES